MRPWLPILVVAVALGQCGGYSSWFSWLRPGKDLCKEMCECSKDLMVASQRGVDCVDKNMTSIQDELQIPSAYPSISFARNRISSISAHTFAESASLRSLDLSQNLLRSLPARAFARLQVLTTLNLRNNEIVSVDQETFAYLQNLTYLDLSYNRLRSLPSNVFLGLGSLQQLNLGFNPLQKLKDSLLQYTPALKRLDLSKLGLTSIHSNFFKGNLTNLSVLVLAYNQLNVVPSRALEPLGASLSHLDLSSNPFKTLDAYSFPGLINLRSLTLEQMLNLRVIRAYAFGDLTRLETLVLRYMPRIISIDPKAFHKTKKSTETLLSLSDFTFSYSSLATLPEDLLPWDRLHFLALQFNQWHCNCNMRWLKNDSSVLQLTGNSMICQEPTQLRGYRLTNIKEEDLTCTNTYSTPHLKGVFVMVLVVMIVGVAGSLGSVALLVYRRRGWLWRPPGAYTSIKRTGSSITITDEDDNTT